MIIARDENTKMMMVLCHISMMMTRMAPIMMMMMMTTLMMIMTTRGITRLVSEAELILGPNTVVVVTPDNGGSVWFVPQIKSCFKT